MFHLSSARGGADLSGNRRGAGGIGGLDLFKENGTHAQFFAFDGNGNVTSLTSAADEPVGTAVSVEVRKDWRSLRDRVRAAQAANNTADEFIANLVATTRPATAPGNIIKLSVAPDGKSFTLAIPANTHSRTYRTTAK